jgi:hypothetical protein
MFMTTKLRLAFLMAAMTATTFATPALALNCGGSCNASNASAVMSEGVGIVLSGSVSAVAASGQLVIESVEAGADTLTIVVKASGKAASTTIKLSGKAIKKVGFVAGQAIELTAISTGHFLVLSGKAVAFIPNEVGQALIDHKKVSN